MKKNIFLLFLILLINCGLLNLNSGNETDNNTEADDDYALTVSIVDIPDSANGNAVLFQVTEFESASASVGLMNGGAITTVNNGRITAVIKVQDLTSGEISNSIKYYTKNAYCIIEVYIDMDGDGNHCSINDICDGDAFSFKITSNNIVNMNYINLNKS